LSVQPTATPLADRSASERPARALSTSPKLQRQLETTLSAPECVPANNLLAVPNSSLLGSPSAPSFPRYVSPSPKEDHPYLLRNQDKAQPVSLHPTSLLSFGMRSLKNPWGIALDLASGSIYVASMLAHTISIYSSLGTFRRTLGGEAGAKPGQFTSPISVAVDRNGNLLVADYGNHRIQVLTPNGDFVRSFGKFGTENGEFRSPRCVAVDPNCGDIWVVDQTNQRIQHFDPDGAFLGAFGKKGATDGLLRNPSYLVVDGRSHSILVSDTGNDRVQRFSLAGDWLASFGSSGDAPGHFSSPQGLAVDVEGKVLVCDHENNRVQIFASDGTYLNHFPVASPEGIVVDRAGAVIVSSGAGGLYVFGTPPKFASATSTSGQSRVSLAAGRGDAGPSRPNLAGLLVKPHNSRSLSLTPPAPRPLAE
jgi:DNA-binding beta-propeller fold protein YncE